MKRFMILIAIGALVLAACASDSGSDASETEDLPMADDNATASSPGDEPIPVEPNGGIGDGASAPGLPVISSELAEEIEVALADLMGRVGDDRLIEVVAAHELTWPDASLGCPQDGMQYAQLLVDGYRIEFADGTYRFIYHGESGGDPFLCVEGEEGSPDLVVPPISLEPVPDPSKETEPTNDRGGPGGTPDE